MRIDNVLPSFSSAVSFNEVTARQAAAVPDDTITKRAGGVIVDISSEAWVAYRQSTEEPRDVSSIVEPPKVCETCKNRTYKDESSDPSVSFQTPTRISPSQAFSSVMAHEHEHVSHEQAKAEEEGRKIISQTVTIKTAACPECGRIYVAGGQTRTVTAADNQPQNEPPSSEGNS